MPCVKSLSGPGDLDEIWVRMSPKSQKVDSLWTSDKFAESCTQLAKGIERVPGLQDAGAPRPSAYANFCACCVSEFISRAPCQ